MSTSSRFTTRAWILVPLCALVFMAWTTWIRIHRVQYVSGLVQEMPSLDESSPANLGGWPSQLIVPQHDNLAYEWLDLARQGLATGDARIRRVDFENAPFGHPVYKPSLYRWWLSALAWSDHAVTGHAPGLSLERAALIADPLLQLIFFLTTSALVLWQFGRLAAVTVSASLVVLFPFAAEFLPGAPSERGLVECCSLWGLLLILAGIRKLDISTSPRRVTDATSPHKRPLSWFAGSGAVMGIGVWLAPTMELPLIFGISAGAFASAWMARPSQNAEHVAAEWIPLWRTWGLSGAASILFCYFVEFAPEHLGLWEMRAIHPLEGVAWLGLAEATAQGCRWIGSRQSFRLWRSVLLCVLGLAAFSALPVTIWRIHGGEYLSLELSALRFSRLYTGAAASHLQEWLSRDGASSLVLGTFFPLLLVAPAVGLLTRRTTDITTRTAIAFALGTAVVVLAYSCRWLSAWITFDAVLIALVAAGTAMSASKKIPVTLIAVWTGAAALALVPSALKVAPSAYGSGTNGVIESDVYGLMERDLARWIASHSGPGGGVVLAPPNTTTTLYYFGGIRGLATLNWENRDGLGVAVRIVSASTPEEAKELIDRRGVTHIVIPSWDPYLDIYARIGMGQLEGTFLSWLHAWKLPNWVRPVAYPVPRIPGFESGTIAVFQVVEEQDDATAGSRTAEYFLEMGQLDRAKAAAQTLRRYPADIGAWVARAEVETASGDEAGLASSFKVLLPMLKSGADRSLAWDLRVGLAVVLARAKQPDLAREQVRKSLAEMDEPNLRALPTGALYRLQVLLKAYQLPITDPKLKELAIELTPSELRGRL